jgi:hypothetical protein
LVEFKVPDELPITIVMLEGFNCVGVIVLLDELRLKACDISVGTAGILLIVLEGSLGEMVVPIEAGVFKLVEPVLVELRLSMLLAAMDGTEGKAPIVFKGSIELVVGSEDIAFRIVLAKVVELSLDVLLAIVGIGSKLPTDMEGSFAKVMPLTLLVIILD